MKLDSQRFGDVIEADHDESRIKKDHTTNPKTKP